MKDFPFESNVNPVAWLCALMWIAIHRMEHFRQHVISSASPFVVTPSHENIHPPYQPRPQPPLFGKFAYAESKRGRAVRGDEKEINTHMQSNINLFFPTTHIDARHKTMMCGFCREHFAAFFFFCCCCCCICSEYIAVLYAIAALPLYSFLISI